MPSPRTPRTPRTPSKRKTAPVERGWYRSTPKPNPARSLLDLLDTAGPSVPRTPTKKRKAEPDEAPSPWAAEDAPTPAEVERLAKMAKCPAYQVPVIIKGRAKVAKWQDIPNWGKRKDCPLLDMLPMEVLDKCFNPEHGLKMRDWISLAGTCTFFRDRLDDDVFRMGGLWHFVMNISLITQDIYSCEGAQRHYEPRHKSTGSTHPASHAFTRPLILTRPERPPLPVAEPLPNPPPYFIPPGPRSSWTWQQYKRYKEEKQLYCANEQHERDMANDMAAQQAYRPKGPDEPTPTIITNKGRVMVTSKRDGLMDGQIMRGEDGKEVEHGELPPRPKEPVPAWAVEPTTEDWETPDTDGEDELGPYIEFQFDANGERTKVDTWPSKYRAKCAKEVNEHWLSQTVQELKNQDAVSQFKVHKQELFAFKHVMTPIYHPKVKNKFASMFRTASVDALKIRCHGDYAHYLERTNHNAVKSQKAQETKQAKAQQAIAEGRAPVTPRRSQPDRTWPAGRQQTLAGPSWARYQNQLQWADFADYPNMCPCRGRYDCENWACNN